MFGLFGSDPFTDPVLGVLTRAGRSWRGLIPLPGHGAVEFRVAGDRKAPDAASLEVARALSARYEALREPIARELFAHYEPYADPVGGGDADAGEYAPPAIASASEVWAHVSVPYVLVDAAHRDFDAEIAYEAAWDEEHTLAARLEADRFVELCGSI